MQDLIGQLARLYLPEGYAVDALAARLGGDGAGLVDLSAGGATRALVLGFDRRVGDGEAGHWQRLCELANVLQAELGLPAPAASISGASGYRLWLSLAEPLPLARARHFLEALSAAWCPEVDLAAGLDGPVELPPCLHRGSGKWAAFIHPGMGASFADDPGLEMAPPLAAQAAFLEGLRSIDEEQLRHAFAVLERARAPEAVPPAGGPAPAGVAQDLLLKDATLEDIVRYLHSKNIEPTFRHVLPPRQGAQTDLTLIGNQ